jgi:hypothetical protein
MQTMLRHRFKSFVVVAALLSSGVALGQEMPGHGPFQPSNVRYNLELFAPPDLSTYGNWPRPNEGFWFQYDRLYMAIQQPSRTEIGVPGGVGTGLINGVLQFDPTNQPVGNILRDYENSLDTGFLRADQTWGNLFQLGWMEDNKGWFINVFNLQDQDQDFTFGDVADPLVTPNGNPRAGLFMVFEDPEGRLLGFVDTNFDGFDDDLNISGPITPTNRVPGVFGRANQFAGGGLPLNLDTNGDGVPDSYAGFADFGDMVALVPAFNFMQVRNVTSMAGVEVNRTWRYCPSHRGGVWEGFFGVRWLLYRDRFNVLAINDEPLVEPVALPGDSYWNTSVDNNMVGPQIGFRWRYSAGRFSTIVEGRFLAAANFQSIHLDGELASELLQIPQQPDPVTGLALEPINRPFNMVRTSFNKWQYDQTFAPVGELRTGVSYQLTKAISVQAGYNLMLGGGISRASRRIRYTLPALDIFDGNNHDAWFVNGMNLGLTVNR